MRQKNSTETYVYYNASSADVTLTGNSLHGEQPLVSVVMNFLNPPEPFFREAIDSIFAQTYDRWELILVDDGSTEASTAVALDYEQQFPGRVRYLEHPGHRNRGMSASRNLGIRQAKGVYVAFLDADDVWLPHKLEKQVAVLESHSEAAFTYGGKIQWHTWSGNAGAMDRFKEMGVPYNTLLPPLELIRYYVRSQAISGVCGILVRRDVAECVGGFDESIMFAEDQTINYKLAARYPAIVTAGQDWKYRRHPYSLSYHLRTFELDKKVAAKLDFLKWVSSFLKRQHIDDPGIWSDFHRTRRSCRLQFVKLSVPKRIDRQFRRFRGLFRSGARAVVHR